MTQKTATRDPKPYNVKYIADPSQDQLRDLAMKSCPAIMKTAYGSINKLTRNKARMAKFTYIIAPESEKSNYTGKTIEPDRAKKLIKDQRRNIEKKDPQRGYIVGSTTLKLGKSRKKT